MSTDRDVTRIVRSWMEEGVTRLPDRVLDSVLDQLPATPQRHTFGLARRRPQMNTYLKFGLAAAAVVAAIVIGLQLIGPTNVGGPSEATPMSSATGTPMAQLNDYDQAPLPAGRYQVDPSLPMVVTVEVPDGWEASHGWVVIGPHGNQAPDGEAIRFYGGDLNLYVNPLATDEGLVDPPVGPSVDDLINAMVDHPDWTTTGPDAITIDGYAGQVVHVTLPPGASHAAPFYLFVDPSGGQIWGWAPDQSFDIYVVDVGGERLVVDTFHFPDASGDDLAARQAVLDSIQLAPAP